MIFLLYSLVSSSFFVLQRYAFLMFFFRLCLFAVVWMVSTRSLISKSSIPFNNPLVIVTRAPITIGIYAIFMLHSFFYCLTRLRYLSFFALSILLSAKPGQQSRQFGKFTFLLLLIITRSGHLAEIKWSVCFSKPLVRMVKHQFLIKLQNWSLYPPNCV